ncbi:MAG: ATP-binding protein [Methylophilus sp.]|jgi:signal transduction histidine kinase
MLKIFKLKLFWKFFSYYFLAQVVSILLVGVLIWFNHQSEDRLRKFENSPQLLLESVVVSLRYSGESAAEKTINHMLKMPGPTVYVVDDSHKELLGRPVNNDLWNSITSHSATLNAAEVTSPSGKKYVVFPLDLASPHLGMRGLFMGHEPPGEHRAMFPIIPLIVGIFVSLFFSVILAWNFLKPINALRKAFGEVEKGNLDVTVAKEMTARNDEISDLGFGFDRMVHQINQLIQGQTRLLHHVSHELRSPLARLQIALGLAKQGSTSIETTLDRIELEVSRMDKLIGDVLDLSKLDSGIKKISKEKISVDELLAEIVDDARYEAKVKRITINKNCASHFEVFANLELIHRAIENIVRNAIKYNVEGGTVEITCSAKSNQLLSISVCDQGFGVNEAEINDLFKPFFKGQSGEKAEGYGLGLAIAKQIIEAHGGEIYAKNQQVGLCVEIVLPLNVTPV